MDISILKLFFYVIGMKYLFFILAFGIIFLCTAQELEQVTRVYGPFEYYASKVGKIGSLVVPPLYTTYKILACEGISCPELPSLAVAGVAWAVSVIYLHRKETSKNETVECSLRELQGLFADFPEVIDSIDAKKIKIFHSCPAHKIETQKFSFDMKELYKMFTGYITYYCIGEDKKPYGKLIVHDEPITHPLITAWAKNKYS